MALERAEDLGVLRARVKNDHLRGTALAASWGLLGESAVLSHDPAMVGHRWGRSATDSCCSYADLRIMGRTGCSPRTIAAAGRRRSSSALRQRAGGWQSIRFSIPATFWSGSGSIRLGGSSRSCTIAGSRRIRGTTRERVVNRHALRAPCFGLGSPMPHGERTIYLGGAPGVTLISAGSPRAGVPLGSRPTRDAPGPAAPAS
jgi:hypothetical protein